MEYPRRVKYSPIGFWVLWFFNVRFICLYFFFIRTDLFVNCREWHCWHLMAIYNAGRWTNESTWDGVAVVVRSNYYVVRGAKLASCFLTYLVPESVSMLENVLLWVRSYLRFEHCLLGKKRFTSQCLSEGNIILWHKLLVINDTLNWFELRAVQRSFNTNPPQLSYVSN